MASFGDYMKAGYSPSTVYDVLAESKFKFKPEKDDGSFFEQFLALQSNPQAVLMKNMTLPSTFQKMASLAGSQ
jgi:hypothetical protein